MNLKSKEITDSKNKIISDFKSGLISKTIKAKREKKGLSVIELAKLVGSSRQAVYDWENGRSIPLADKWELIKVVLEWEYPYDNTH